jgi:hypothetical protein
MQQQQKLGDQQLLHLLGFFMLHIKPLDLADSSAVNRNTRKSRESCRECSLDEKKVNYNIGS